MALAPDDRGAAPSGVAAGWRSACTLGPRDHRVFAGAFDRANADFSGMGLAERTLVRRLMPSGDWRNWPEIEDWARGIAQACSRDWR